MQTLDLLFAIQLRNLAADLHSAARANYYTGIFGRYDEDGRRTMLAAWENENPVSRFIPVALEEVEHIAEQTYRLLKQ
jgi:hypothetical protein